MSLMTRANAALAAAAPSQSEKQEAILLVAIEVESEVLASHRAKLDEAGATLDVTVTAMAQPAAADNVNVAAAVAACSKARQQHGTHVSLIEKLQVRLDSFQIAKSQAGPRDARKALISQSTKVLEEADAVTARFKKALALLDHRALSAELENGACRTAPPIITFGRVAQQEAHCPRRCRLDFEDTFQTPQEGAPSPTRRDRLPSQISSGRKAQQAAVLRRAQCGWPGGADGRGARSHLSAPGSKIVTSRGCLQKAGLLCRSLERGRTRARCTQPVGATMVLHRRPGCKICFARTIGRFLPRQCALVRCGRQGRALAVQWRGAH
mmetsp:Transcript_7588/g.22365  ORF Transcript_7588/g.22365 Transcript_7588/m.22365 type:complete len:324 (-) Transcript_7588:1074-2045(-)